MPTEKKVARWKIVLGYVSFTIVSLIIGFFLTFPYDVLSERIQNEALNLGYVVKIGSMGPGLGIVARQVQIRKLAQPSDEKAPEALSVEKISFRPTLLPLGVAIHSSLMGGSLQMKVGQLKDAYVTIHAETLDLAKGNFKGFSGVDVTGTMSAHLDLAIPLTTLGKGPKELDLGGANGNLQVEFNDLAINGGTVKMVIPMYGPEPTPLDLPKFALGNFRGLLPIEKGTATVKAFELKGNGIESKGTGSVKLAKRFDYSELNLELRLKAEDSFTKSLLFYGAGLKVLRTAPNEPGWKILQLTGFVSRPNFK